LLDYSFTYLYFIATKFIKKTPVERKKNPKTYGSTKDLE
jgi:hypothetical protein